jgi:ADP-ribose pyrophosphatase
VRKDTVETRVAWEGRSWRLNVLRYLFPDGTVKERGVIDHPGSVLIVPFENNQVLMLRQFRIALDSTILELPAGTREPGEEWLSCAQRELREETGFAAAKWISLGKVWPAPGITNEFMAVYLGRELTEAPLPADGDEEIEVVSFDFDELISMALSGELQDAKSVVGILRAAAYLKMLPQNQAK